MVFKHGGILDEEDLAGLNINVKSGKNIFIYCCPDNYLYSVRNDKDIEYLDVSFLELNLLMHQYDIMRPGKEFITKILYNGSRGRIVCIVDVYGNLILPDVVHYADEDAYDNFIDLFLSRIFSVLGDGFMYKSFRDKIDNLVELSKHIPIEVKVTYKDMSSIFKTMILSCEAIIDEFKNKIASLEKLYRNEINNLKENIMMLALGVILEIIKMGYTIEKDNDTVVFIGSPSKIKDGDTIYSIPNDKFKIKVSIQNREGEVALIDKGSFHPNIGKTACYGDKLPYTIENIKEALRRLLIINLNSAYANEASVEASRLVTELEKKGEIWRI